jgi:hypothetical protein
VHFCLPKRVVRLWSILFNIIYKSQAEIEPPTLSEEKGREGSW